jgi:hypothetical protein
LKLAHHVSQDLEIQNHYEINILISGIFFFFFFFFFFSFFLASIRTRGGANRGDGRLTPGAGILTIFTIQNVPQPLAKEIENRISQ